MEGGLEGLSGILSVGYFQIRKLIWHCTLVYQAMGLKMYVGGESWPGIRQDNRFIRFSEMQSVVFTTFRHVWCPNMPEGPLQCVLLSGLNSKTCVVVVNNATLGLFVCCIYSHNQKAASVWLYWSQPAHTTRTSIMRTEGEGTAGGRLLSPWRETDTVGTTGMNERPTCKCPSECSVATRLGRVARLVPINTQYQGEKQKKARLLKPQHKVFQKKHKKNGKTWRHRRSP